MKLKKNKSFDGTHVADCSIESNDEMPKHVMITTESNQDATIPMSLNDFVTTLSTGVASIVDQNPTSQNDTVNFIYENSSSSAFEIHYSQISIEEHEQVQNDLHIHEENDNVLRPSNTSSQPQHNINNHINNHIKQINNHNNNNRLNNLKINVIEKKEQEPFMTRNVIVNTNENEGRKKNTR